MVTARLLQAAAQAQQPGPQDRCEPGQNDTSTALPRVSGNDSYAGDLCGVPISYGEKLVLEMTMKYRGRVYDRRRQDELAQPCRAHEGIAMEQGTPRRFASKEEERQTMGRLATPRRRLPPSFMPGLPPTSRPPPTNFDLDAMVSRLAVKRHKTAALRSAAWALCPRPGEEVLRMYNQPLPGHQVDHAYLADLAKPKRAASASSRRIRRGLRSNSQCSSTETGRPPPLAPPSLPPSVPEAGAPASARLPGKARPKSKAKADPAASLPVLPLGDPTGTGIERGHEEVDVRALPQDLAAAYAVPALKDPPPPTASTAAPASAGHDLGMAPEEFPEIKWSAGSPDGAPRPDTQDEYEDLLSGAEGLQEAPDELRPWLSSTEVQQLQLHEGFSDPHPQSAHVCKGCFNGVDFSGQPCACSLGQQAHAQDPGGFCRSCAGTGVDMLGNPCQCQSVHMAAEDGLCRACSNTGEDFLGNPCSCRHGRLHISSQPPSGMGTEQHITGQALPPWQPPLATLGDACDGAFWTDLGQSAAGLPDPWAARLRAEQAQPQCDPPSQDFVGGPLQAPPEGAEQWPEEENSWPGDEAISDDDG